MRVNPVDPPGALRRLGRLGGPRRHYQILFEGTDLKRELLQGIAPTFFGDINRLLIEHIILKICQITDPEGRKNLTIKFLMKNSDFSTVPGEHAKLKRLGDSMHAFRAKIVPARNRLIGHLDRESVWLGQPLGGAEPNAWNQFWLDLQDFLYIMHRHYVDSEWSLLPERHRLSVRCGRAS